MSQTETKDGKFQPKGKSRRDRRLKHLLLEPRFQLKYTSMIVGIATVISVILGAFLISKVRENSRMLALDDAFAAELAAQDAAVIGGLVAGFLVFLFVLTALSIYVTHRMAGPVFVMRRYLRELSRGGLPKIRSLRKGDEFSDLLDDFIMTVDALEERTMTELSVLRKVQEALQSGQELQEDMKKELANMIEEKHEAVERRRTPDAPPGRGSSSFGDQF
jgi:methyl-accepting chemotaxis protein